MSEVSLVAALGSRAVAQAIETIDTKTLGDIAKRLLTGELAENTKLQEFPGDLQEFGPLAAVAIGFAAGAAARLAGKDRESAKSGTTNTTDEMFPVVVAAFLAGAAAGSRAVDGKL